MPFASAGLLRGTEKEDKTKEFAQKEGPLSNTFVGSDAHERVKGKKRRSPLGKILFIGGSILCLAIGSYRLRGRSAPNGCSSKKLKYRSLEKVVKALLKANKVEKEPINSEILLEAIGNKNYDREFLKWLIEVKKADVNYVSKARKKKTVLFIALVQKQDEALIRWLINSQGADCTCKDTAENTMLHIAVRQGYNKAFIQWLVKERRVDCTQKNMHGETVLPAALRAGYDETFIKEWLMKQLDPSEALREILCYFGRESINEEKCKELITHLKSQGAVAPQRRDKKDRVLTLALKGNYTVSFIEWLITQKVIVLGGDEKDVPTARLWFDAIVKKDHPLGFFELLMQQGVVFNKDIRTNPFLQTIDYFGDQAYSEKNKQKCIDIILYFQSRKAYTMSFQSGNKVFTLALKKKHHIDFITFLIDQKGFDLNQALWEVIDYFKDEPAPTASLKCLAIISYLVNQKGVDLNQKRTLDGETILTFALKKEYPDFFIELLIAQGADPKLGNAISQTTADIAFVVGYRSDFIEKLIERGVAVSSKVSFNGYTYSILKLALEKELDLRFLELLISQNRWDINESLWQVISYFGISQTYYDSSSDFIARYKKNRYNQERCKAITAYLIEKGANMHAKKEGQSTAFTMALGFYDYPIDFIKWLIDQKGVDLHKTLFEVIDYGAHGPKLETELERYKEIISHLSSKAKFEPNFTDKEGDTALGRSILGGYPAEFSIWLIERKMNFGVALLEVIVSIRFYQDGSIVHEEEIKKILNFLWKKGVNMNYADKFADTALSLALVQKCPVDFISYLIGLGANPNQDEEAQKLILSREVCDHVHSLEEVRAYYQSVTVALIMQGAFDLDTKVQLAQVSGLLDPLCIQEYNIAIGAFCLKCKEEDELRRKRIRASFKDLKWEEANTPFEAILRLLCTFLPSSFQRRLYDSNATICFNAWDLANLKVKPGVGTKKNAYLEQSEAIANHYIAIYQKKKEEAPKRKTKVLE